MQAALETGQAMPFAGGELAAYAVVDYATLRGDGFIEQGNTGFELIAQALAAHNRPRRASACATADRWHWGGRAGCSSASTPATSRRVVDGRLQAAFTGTPEARFDLAGRAAPERPRARSRLLLSGAGGARWTWQLQYGN